MTYASTSRGKLWYEIEGEGEEQMVLLHGGGFGRGTFDQVMPVLRPMYELMSYDLWGFGKSEANGIENAGAIEWADDLAELLDDIGWDRPHIHGTSLGGTVALAFAARHPSRCRSVAVNACSAKADTAHRLLFEAMEDHARLAGGITRSSAAFIVQGQMEPEYLDAHPEAVDEIERMMRENSPIDTWIAMLRSMQTVDLVDLLPTITVPTLVMSGEHDMDLDQGPKGAGLRRIAELVPGARLELIPGASHITIIEAPEQHAAALKRFTDSVDR